MSSRRQIRRTGARIASLIGLVLTCGCVERLLVIRTDAPGARVFVDGHEVGDAPHIETFSFYGVREVTVRAEGRAKHTELVDLEEPWWQYPPFDFIVENVLPWTEHDVHDVFVALQPLDERTTDLDATLIRAQDLKLRSQEGR